MTGKLVLASEKDFGKKKKELIKTPVTKEPSFITSMKDNLAKIGIGTPESKWQILPLQDPYLESNT
jgi:hypothetical protein